MDRLCTIDARDAGPDDTPRARHHLVHHCQSLYATTGEKKIDTVRLNAFLQYSKRIERANTTYHDHITTIERKNRAIGSAIVEIDK